MRISQLESFVAVAKHRNFTKASQDCFLVQSTISHQIKTLENELGVKLIERDSHSVFLTPAGEQFFQDIVRPLELLQQATLRAQSIASGKAGSLSVGVSSVNQADRLDRVRCFHQTSPGISVSYARVGSYNVLRKLDNGSFDIALIGIPKDLSFPYSTAEVFLEKPYFVAASSHVLASYSKISVHEAFRYSVLFAKDENLTDEENRMSIVRNFGVKEELSANIVLTEDMDIMQLMLEAGEGIALVPESIIEYEKHALKVIEIMETLPSIRVGWIYRRDNPNPVLHQFVAFLQKNKYHD
jgi:LysR family transcriptional activator of glutamate synthase operon